MVIWIKMNMRNHTTSFKLKNKNMKQEKLDLYTSNALLHQ